MRAGLVVLCSAFAVAADPPAATRAEQVTAVRKGAKAEIERINDEFVAATTPDGKAAARKKLAEVVKRATDKLLALAKALPTDEPAFQALTDVLFDGDRAAATDLLIQHHLGREGLAEALKEIAPDPDPAFDRLLRATAEKSTLPANKMAGQLLLGWRLADAAGASGDAKAFAEADALLTGASKEFGDQRWESVTVREVADHALKVLRTLSVGRPAPEFASRDLDGKPAKLSDLKGKVVVLDIWATNCGPCRQMIPHERELVKRLAGRPFVLVSVSADRTKADLTEFLKDTPMPWTHWYEGDGPNLAAWDVKAFPTIFVIDAKGVIRHRGVRGKAMDEAVEKLLAEADAGK